MRKITKPVWVNIHEHGQKRTFVDKSYYRSQHEADVWARKRHSKLLYRVKVTPKSAQVQAP